MVIKCIRNQIRCYCNLSVLIKWSVLAFGKGCLPIPLKNRISCLTYVRLKEAHFMTSMAPGDQTGFLSVFVLYKLNKADGLAFKF